jgi:hypothetical protein
MLASEFGTELGFDLLKSIVGTIVSAVVIAPVVGLYITSRQNSRWRRFRRYIAQLMEENHRHLLKSLDEARTYLVKLSLLSPNEVRAIDESELYRHRDTLRGALRRMEEIGVRFHFAMNPKILEGWQAYHALAFETLRDPNETTWHNVGGVVSAVKRGYEGFESNPNMFDDVFSQPTKFAAGHLAALDATLLEQRLKEFVSILTK